MGYSMDRGHGKSGGRDVLSGMLLAFGGLAILATMAGAAYVSYEAMYDAVLAHNGGDEARAYVTAALPDAGWAAMAVVALVAALRGRSSARARLGVLLLFGLSLATQVAAAPHDTLGVLVALIAPISLAWMLETWVVEVRRWAGERRGLDLDASPIISGLLRSGARIPYAAGRPLLWFARLVLDRSGTWSGLRCWVLDEAPLAPGRTAASLRAAAAIEAAGGVEAQARAAREAALAEAEQIRAAALAEAEQVRADASAAVEQARQDAAAAVERERAAAAELVDGVGEQAAQRVAQIERAAGEQVEQARRFAEQQLAQVRRELGGELAELRDTLARVQGDRERERRELGETARAARVELDEMRGRYERVLAAAPARTRLVELYDALRGSGDPRWGRREYVGELARELAPRAGLQSEGTARTYLADHLSEMSATGAALS